MTALDKKKPIILFGAGQIGKKALDFYGTDRVRFFVDNFKAGLYYYGIPILSMEDLRQIHNDYEIVITTLPKFQNEIKEQMDTAGIHGATVFDSSDPYGMFESDARLEKFRNKHEGKRCFLLGNGPSLSVKDLDAIAAHGDISFAANKIYKFFGQTVWRPDYYFAVDPHLLSQNWEGIAAVKETKFLARNILNWLPLSKTDRLIDNDNTYLFQSRYLEYDPEKKAFRPEYDLFNEAYPAFSEDASKFVYEGFSVIYVMIQWAAYMGFTELFLLGVDYNYKETCNYFEHFVPPQEFLPQKGSEHFCDDYFKEGERVSVPDMHATGMSFKKAEDYSRHHGFRIFNATREGNLEVFERVDLDSLWNFK